LGLNGLNATNKREVKGVCVDARGAREVTACLVRNPNFSNWCCEEYEEIAKNLNKVEKKVFRFYKGSMDKWAIDLHKDYQFHSMDLYESVPLLGNIEIPEHYVAKIKKAYDLKVFKPEAYIATRIVDCILDIVLSKWLIEKNVYGLKKYAYRGRTEHTLCYDFVRVWLRDLIPFVVHPVCWKNEYFRFMMSNLSNGKDANSKFSSSNQLPRQKVIRKERKKAIKGHSQCKHNSMVPEPICPDCIMGTVLGRVNGVMDDKESPEYKAVYSAMDKMVDMTGTIIQEKMSFPMVKITEVFTSVWDKIVGFFNSIIGFFEDTPEWFASITLIISGFFSMMLMKLVDMVGYVKPFIGCAYDWLKRKFTAQKIIDERNTQFSRVVCICRDIPSLDENMTFEETFDQYYANEQRVSCPKCKPISNNVEFVDYIMEGYKEPDDPKEEELSNYCYNTMSTMMTDTTTTSGSTIIGTSQVTDEDYDKPGQLLCFFIRIFVPDRETNMMLKDFGRLAGYVTRKLHECFNQMMFYITGDISWKVPEDVRIVETSLIMASEILRSPVFMNEIQNPVVFKQLKGLVMEMENNLILIASKKDLGGFSHLYARTYEKIKALYDKALFTFVDRTRSDPDVIAFVGESCAGKSKLCKVFAKILGEVMVNSGIIKGDGKFDMSMHTHTYIPSKFWDGYKNQPILMINEFLTAATITDEHVTSVVEFLSVLDDSVKPLNMAELQDKGNTYFTSKLVLINSNRINFENIGLKDPEALYNRIPFIKVIKKNILTPEEQKRLATDPSLMDKGWALLFPAIEGKIRGQRFRATVAQSLQCKEEEIESVFLKTYKMDILGEIPPSIVLGWTIASMRSKAMYGSSDLSMAQSTHAEVMKGLNKIGVPTLPVHAQEQYLVNTNVDMKFVKKDSILVADNDGQYKIDMMREENTSILDKCASYITGVSQCRNKKSVRVPSKNFQNAFDKVGVWLPDSAYCFFNRHDMRRTLADDLQMTRKFFVEFMKSDKNKRYDMIKKTTITPLRVLKACFGAQTEDEDYKFFCDMISCEVGPDDELGTTTRSMVSNYLHTDGKSVRSMRYIRSPSVPVVFRCVEKYLAQYVSFYSKSLISYDGQLSSLLAFDILECVGATMLGIMAGLMVVGIVYGIVLAAYHKTDDDITGYIAEATSDMTQQQMTNVNHWIRKDKDRIYEELRYAHSENIKAYVRALSQMGASQSTDFTPKEVREKHNKISNSSKGPITGDSHLSTNELGAYAKITANMVSLVFTDALTSRKVDGLFLCNSIILTVYHPFRMPFTQMTVKTGSLEKGGSTSFNKMSLDVVELKGTKSRPFYADLCLVRIGGPSPAFAGVPSIIGYFTDSFLNQEVTRVGKATGISGNGSLVLCHAHGVPVKEEGGFYGMANANNKKYTTNLCEAYSMYDTTCKNGDCGQVYLTQAGGSIKAYFMHIGGSGSRAIMAPLYNWVIKAGLAEINSLSYSERYKPMVPVTDVTIDWNIPPPRVNEGVLSVAGVTHYHSGEGGTSLEPSILQQSNASVEFVTSNSVCPVIRKVIKDDEGNSVSPWAYPNKKMEVTNNPPCPEEVIELRKTPKWFAYGIFDDVQPYNKYSLTIQEVLFGSQWTKPAVRHSAVGTDKYVFGTNDRHELWDPDTEYINPKLEELYNKYIDNVLSGTPIISVAKELKDETLGVEDVLYNGKVRAYGVGPLMVYLICTGLFGQVMHSLKSSKSSPFVYGYNPHNSNSVWMLHSILKSLKKKFSQDASGNDYCSPKYLGHVFAEVLADWYTDDRESAAWKIRYVWASTVTDFFWINGDTASFNTKGFCSGHPLTSLFNSFCHLIIRRVVFYRLYKKEMLDNIRCIIHGDDVVMEFNEDYSEFNPENIAKLAFEMFGYVLTSADKKETYTFEDDFEYEFLGRRFTIIDIDGTPVGTHALKKSSIYGMLNWVRTDVMSNLEATKTNVYVAAIEAVYHGKEFYEGLMKDISTASGKYRIDTPSWKEMSMRYLNTTWHDSCHGYVEDYIVYY